MCTFCVLRGLGGCRLGLLRLLVSGGHICDFPTTPEERIMVAVEVVFEHFLDMLRSSGGSLEVFEDDLIDVRSCGGFGDLFNLVTKR